MNTSPAAKRHRIRHLPQPPIVAEGPQVAEPVRHPPLCRPCRNGQPSTFDDKADTRVHDEHRPADAPQLPLPPCRHWTSKGSCRYGDLCGFGHSPDLRGPTSDHYGIPAESGGRSDRRGKRRQVRKSGRAAALAAFAAETFPGGADALRDGGGVIDVAGGAGEVSFHLANLYDVPSAVLDPRPPKLYGCVRRHEMGMYLSRKQTTKRRIGDSSLREVQHLPLYGDTELLRLILSFSRSGGWTDEQRNHDRLKSLIGKDHHLTILEDDNEAAVIGADDSGATDGAIPPKSPEKDGNRRRRLAANCVQPILDPSDALHRLASFSCVVGMHPDQGTEFAIDLAISFGRPFFVVPCCVCGRQFPNRSLRDETPVGSSYERFLQYLMEKDPTGGIQRATLDFGGKNQVLYWLGYQKDNRCDS